MTIINPDHIPFASSSHTPISKASNCVKAIKAKISSLWLPSSALFYSPSLERIQRLDENLQPRTHLIPLLNNNIPPCLFLSLLPPAPTTRLALLSARTMSAKCHDPTKTV